MTIITENFATLGLTPDSDVTVSFCGVPIRENSVGDGVITPTPIVVRAVAGVVTSPELDPGPARVEVAAEGWFGIYDVMIPAAGTHRLFDLEEIVISEHKVIVKGDRGDVGAGVNLAGTVANYAELAAITLGPADAGKAYVNNGDGLLYVWSGNGWPAEGDGAAFRGLQGLSLATIAVQGNKLLFGLSDSTALPPVTVPALTQASQDAAAAHTDRLAAETAQSAAAAARAGAEAAQDLAETARTDAYTARDAAAGHRTAAAGSATAAAGSAGAAADSAAAADQDRAAVDTAKGQIDGAYADVMGARTDTYTARDAAQGHANTATEKANAAAQDAVDADAARAAAQQAAQDAQNVGGVPTTRRVEGVGALTGGGDLAADRELDLTPEAKGFLALAGGASQPGHTHVMDDITDLGAELDTALSWKADLVDDGAGGRVIPTSLIPAIATTKTVVVATSALRLALTAGQVQSDDRVVQTNNPGRGTYFLTGTDRTQESSWTLAVAPTDVVQSVNGQNGVVVLAKGDVGLGSADNTSDAQKVASGPIKDALAGKAGSHPGQTIVHFVGTQAAYDALSAATKNAVGFVAVVY